MQDPCRKMRKYWVRIQKWRSPLLLEHFHYYREAITLLSTNMYVKNITVVHYEEEKSEGFIC